MSMPIWSQFSVDTIRAVVFTPDHTAFASGKAVASVLSSYGSRFDGEMQVLSLPTEIPAEIPHVQLKSSDQKWQLNMAPARTDCIWQNKSHDATVNFATIASECIDVLIKYVGDAKVGVGRVALTVQRFHPADDPAAVLTKRFCNAESLVEPLNRSASFEIHNRKTYSIKVLGSSVQINSWVRCKSGKVVSNDSPVILVEQDINTPGGTESRFEPEMIKAIITTVSTEIDDILRKYFPGMKAPK